MKSNHRARETPETYIYPILPGTDWQEHTPSRPFCTDETCPCHENPSNIRELEQYRQEGLVSNADCDRIYHGTTIERRITERWNIPKQRYP